MSDALDEHERWCHEMLRMLRESYEKQAEPYLQQLGKIHAIRMPSWKMSTAQAELMAAPIEPPVFPGKGY